MNRDIERLRAQNERLRKENLELRKSLAASAGWMERAMSNRAHINQLTAEMNDMREDAASLGSAVSALLDGARTDRATIDAALSLGDRLLNALATRKDSSGLPGFQGEVLSVVLAVIDRWMSRNGLCPGIRPGVLGRLEALTEQLSDALVQAQSARAAAWAVTEGDNADVSKARTGLIEACRRDGKALN